MNRQQITYDFTPSPGPQTAAFQYAPDELFYGGAAGGGKSRMARAAGVIFCLSVPGVRAILFRNSFPEIRDAVEAPMLAEIPEALATYNKSSHEFRFINGSVLRLAHLKSDTDLPKYQGAEYQLVIFEELTHFTERQYLYLKSRLRVAGPVRRAMEAMGLRPRMIATGNPGGRGHHWVKARFVDPVKPGVPFRLAPTEDDPEPGVRLYIHAKATDNPHLDSGYTNMLNALPEGEKQALRDGDWNVLDGVRFPGFRTGIHVIDPEDFPIPEHAVRALGVDWGTHAPFAGVWVAKVGNIFVAYREAYAKDMGTAEQAALLASMETHVERGPGRLQTPVVLDPAMWARAAANPLKSNDPNSAPPGSTAWYYQKVFGSAVRKANNDRLGGASTIDQLLTPVDIGNGEKMPRLFIYSTCRNLIRTLPALPRDDKNPEDVDTKAEDHAYDALRYALMSMLEEPLTRPDAANFGRKVRNTTAGVRTKQL